MTSLTTNYALPYPDGTNRPCDFAQDWCTFTDSVQSVIDGYQAIVDRTVPVIPIARLLVTTPVVMISDDEVVFDTVSVDTAGWVDFDADPSGITTDRAGRFVAHGWLRFKSGTLNNLVQVHIRYTDQIQNPDDSYFDRATGFDTAGNTATLTALTAPTRWSMTAFNGNGANMTLQSAGFTVFWHADRATP